MGKFMLLVIVFCLALSCKQGTEKETLEEKPEVFLSVDSLPRPIAVNAKVTELLKGWQAFKDMENTFESLYRVDNREDLSLVIEDLIEKQKQLEASEYPEMFNKPQIKSRQKVFQTYILKTKGNLEYRVNTNESTMAMIEAYNAFRGQFNVLVNSELDTTLIFNE
ncbi:hypothetical protein [Arenibacter latericius]|uniref:hypothetical protein n=1 Tax=Arenibacter latericius TaxID=86104 RepID=UPI00047E32E5|nr:hypothetical protein [Arenibacter latericius]